MAPFTIPPIRLSRRAIDLFACDLVQAPADLTLRNGETGVDTTNEQRREKAGGLRTGVAKRETRAWNRERGSSVGVSFPCGPHRFNAIIWAEGRGIRVISEKEARKGPVSKGSKLLRPLFFLDTFRSSYFSFPFSFYVLERERERGRGQPMLSHLVLEGPEGAGII